MKKYIFFLLTAWANLGATSAHAQTQPANDLCTNAISVACGNTVSSRTTGATTTGAPGIFCGTNITAPGVWFKFIGNGDSVSLDLCSGSDYDTKLHVFSGSCSVLQCVVGNDDACGTQSKVGFTSQDNTTYYVYISGFGSSTGNYQMDITCYDSTYDPPTPKPFTQLGNDLNGEARGEEFGWSVSLSHNGDTMAVGTPVDGNGINAGRVRIYAYDANSDSWNQLGSDIVGEAAEDFLGSSVSLSADGRRVAIGASGNDGNGTDAGHTRIYEYDATTTSWNQVGSDIDGETFYDRSGYSVSLSADGRRVAIGAPFNDGYDDASFLSGHTRIYEYDASTTTWTQLGRDIDGETEDDQSGRSVSLSADGRRVAIGAIYNDGNGTDAGHTRIYEYDASTTTWTQLGRDIDGEAEDDQSGYSVSLSADGRRVAIGAYLNDGDGEDAGHTRIYEYNASSSSWTQLGSDIDGEATDDFSGSSVSLSADGRRVAIRALNNDGNGTNSGHTQIYEYDATTTGWTQLGSDIDGEAVGDESGFSVSLSADGSRVAIGAPFNDGNVIDAGHVRVFQLAASTSTKEKQATTTGQVQVFANGNALILRDEARVLDPATQIRLFDLTGREVLRAPATAQEVISLDGLNPGIYLYRLEGSAIQQAGKVAVR